MKSFRVLSLDWSIYEVTQGLRNHSIGTFILCIFFAIPPKSNSILGMAVLIIRDSNKIAHNTPEASDC